MRQNTKNRKVLIIVAMLVLLATVFAMSGMTFAKYVSNTAIPTKQATVAKWGWIISTNSENLFGTNYGDYDEDSTIVSVKNDGKSVSSSGTTTLVAPGTTGYLTFTVYGTSEVRSLVTITADGTDEVYLTDGDQTYAPIVWTLSYSADNSTTYTEVANVGKTLEDCLDYINALTGADGKIVEANATLPLNGTYKLTWEWAFSGANSTINDPRNISPNNQTTLTADECDTLIGQVGTAANLVGTGDFANFTAGTQVVNINVSINVEQVQ